MDGDTASIGAVATQASTWTVEVVWGNCGIDIDDRCLESEQLCVPRQNLGVKIRQQLETKVWIQTKVLFQTKVEQGVDPNWNQMEQSEGLEVIKSKDMEVGLRKDQPWKRGPV